MKCHIFAIAFLFCDQSFLWLCYHCMKKGFLQQKYRCILRFAVMWFSQLNIFHLKLFIPERHLYFTPLNTLSYLYWSLDPCKSSTLKFLALVANDFECPGVCRKTLQWTLSAAFPGQTHTHCSNLLISCSVRNVLISEQECVWAQHRVLHNISGT